MEHLFYVVESAVEFLVQQEQDQKVEYSKIDHKMKVDFYSSDLVEQQQLFS